MQSTYKGHSKSSYIDTVNHKICTSYFVTFQHSFLQQKRTWSSFSPKLGFCCRRIVTSPMGVVAKYCDEYVCLSVCLSRRISPEQYRRFLPIFCACCLCLWLSPPPASNRIGRITYHRKGGDGSAQHGRSAIYECLVNLDF